MDNAEVALLGVNQSLPFVEKSVYGRRSGIEVQDIGLVFYEWIMRQLDWLGLGESAKGEQQK